MSYRMLQGLAGLFGPLLLATTLAARTMYATDTSEIVVRSESKIAERNIIKVLPSGALPS